MRGFKTKVGIKLISSNFLANIPFIMPAKANNTDDSIATKHVTTKFLICKLLKCKDIIVINNPIIKPLIAPPNTYPIMITELLVGDINSSSMLP